MLELRNIKKSYRDYPLPVLHGVSLTLQHNEIVALTGESGSGKSTLLHIAAALEDADDGAVYLEGEKLKPPSEQLVAGNPRMEILTQHLNLFPNFTVADNITYFLRRFTRQYQKQRTDELLTLCRLTDIEKRLPRQLSGGQRQRVALAKALSKNPDILFFDEPFSSLDAATKQDLRQDLKQILKQEHKTALFALHDATDAFLLAEKIIVLQKGQIAQTGTPTDIYNNPISDYVARLFGEINTIKKGQNTIRLRPEDFKIVGNDDDTDLKGTVKEINFCGFYNRLSIKTLRNGTIVVYDFSQKIRLKENVNLQIKTANRA